MYYFDCPPDPYQKTNLKSLDYFQFLVKLNWRMTFAFDDYCLPYQTYKRDEAVLKAFKFQIDNAHFPQSYLKSWFNNHIDGKTFDTGLKLQEDKQLINLLDKCVNELILPNAKKYYGNQKSEPVPEATPAIVESAPLPSTSDVIAESKKTKGRPKGSKNKKESVVFMPNHSVGLTTDFNGKSILDMQTVLMAIADLVWRKPNRIDKEYLDLLKLTEPQRKYLDRLFIHKSSKLDNKWWEFKEVGKISVLAPKLQRRAGWYCKVEGNYTLAKLSSLSEKYQIAEMTLIYRLQKMSVAEAVKK